LHPPKQSLEITDVVEWRNGEVRRVVDYLAAEEPLEIRVNGTPFSVAMRTPGHDLELTAGFLLTEGIIDKAEQLKGIRTVLNEKTGKNNLVEVEIVAASCDPVSMQRNFFVASSCGVCGKASIESIRRRGLRAPNPHFRVTSEVLCSLADKLRGDQLVFEKTGGLHAAGLFTAEGDLLVLREDIGRHNAVDKLIGKTLLEDRVPLRDRLLLLSGRASFELLQKAVMGGVPMVASVGAPSSLALEVARDFDVTLVGFLRDNHFNVYHGSSRIQARELAKVSESG